MALRYCAMHSGRIESVLHALPMLAWSRPRTRGDIDTLLSVFSGGECTV